MRLRINTNYLKIMFLEQDLNNFQLSSVNKKKTKNKDKKTSLVNSIKLIIFGFFSSIYNF